MRTTKLSIQKNGSVNLLEATTPIGYSGEHNTVLFVLQLSEQTLSYFGNPQYFRFVINGSYSEPIYENENEIRYCLPQSCLIPPKINCQIIGYVISDGVPKEISKSSVFELEVGVSEGMQGQTDLSPNAMESALARCEKFESDSATNAKNANAYSESALESATIATNAANSSLENASKAEQVLLGMEEAADSGRFDGFSPIAKVTATNGGVTISITDKSGTTEQPIYHGISPDLRRCFRFIGALQNKSDLPEFAAVGDVYSVGAANVLFNDAVAQTANFGALPINVKSFDFYAKTDSTLTAGGESYLYLVCNEPIDVITGVSNFEGENTLYLHFEIADSVLTVTGERVYNEGKEYESRHSIMKEITLPEEIYYMGFYLESEERNEESGVMFDGPAFSIARITEATEGIPMLYVFGNDNWLPFSPEAEVMESALDSILAIQEALIGGAE